MQVALYLAGEITQVKESIPWVLCASGNVFMAPHMQVIVQATAVAAPQPVYTLQKTESRLYNNLERKKTIY